MARSRTGWRLVDVATRTASVTTLRHRLRAHLGSRQVSRVIYGAIIGLALIIGLKHHASGSAAVIASLVGTAIAVALAELFSEVVGEHARARRRLTREESRALAVDAGAVAFGITFPCVFFVLELMGVIQLDTAFDMAKWSGLVLTGLYGFAAARLAGQRVAVALLYAIAIDAVAGFLIVLKALVH